MAIQMHVCGARGSFPTFGGDYEVYGHDTSCYVIMLGDYALVLDCGSGLLNAVPLLEKCSQIDILLSHVHYDHIMGLFENKKCFENKEVHFYGDFDSWMREEKGKNGIPALCLIENYVYGTVHQVTHGSEIQLGHHIRAVFTPSNHEDYTSMIKLWIRDKIICFTGDYEHQKNSGIESWAKNADLLLFDGSYSTEDYKKFKGWGHSKWEDGCDIAKGAGVKHLVITHYAPQYTDSYIAQEEQKAQKQFVGVTFAKQNEVIEIP